jgi:hypothetical protein
MPQSFQGGRMPDAIMGLNMDFPQTGLKIGQMEKKNSPQVSLPVVSLSATAVANLLINREKLPTALRRWLISESIIRVRPKIFL